MSIFFACGSSILQVANVMPLTCFTAIPSLVHPVYQHLFSVMASRTVATELMSFVLVCVYQHTYIT